MVSLWEVPFLVDLLSLSSLFCMCGWVGLLLVSEIGKFGLDLMWSVGPVDNTDCMYCMKLQWDSILLPRSCLCWC